MPDNYRTRRIIIITIIVLIALLLAYAFYRLLASRGQGLVPGASPQPPVSGSVGQNIFALETPILPEVTPLTSPTAGLEQKIQEQTLLALTDFSVVSPVIAKSQDKVLLYKKDGGSRYQVDFAANQEKMSNITIVGLTEALWSPARDRAAVFYIDGEVLKSFLHTGTSSVLALPRDIKSFAWSPDGKQFAYLIQTSDGVSLIISDASGKSSKEVFQTPILDAQIQWISADKIAFQTAPSGHAEGYVFIYSLKTSTFRRFLGPLYGLTTLWSPDATHLLVSATDAGGGNLTLSLYDSAATKLERLDFLTITDKCAWISTKEFYCAVPNAFPDTAVMPDDYLRGEVATQDRILSFALDTSNTALIFSGGAMDIANLAITAKKDYLIFVNRTDGIPWRLKLAQ